MQRFAHLSAGSRHVSSAQSHIGENCGIWLQMRCSICWLGEFEVTRFYFCVSAMFIGTMHVNMVKIKFVEMDRGHKIWQDEVVSRFLCTKHFVWQ